MPHNGSVDSQHKAMAEGLARRLRDAVIASRRSNQSQTTTKLKRADEFFSRTAHVIGLNALRHSDDVDEQINRFKLAVMSILLRKLKDSTGSVAFNGSDLEVTLASFDAIMSYKGSEPLKRRSGPVPGSKLAETVVAILKLEHALLSGDMESLDAWQRLVRVARQQLSGVENDLRQQAKRAGTDPEAKVEAFKVQIMTQAINRLALPENVHLRRRKQADLTASADILDDILDRHTTAA